MKNEFWVIVTHLIGWFWRVFRCIEKWLKLVEQKSICEVPKCARCGRRIGL